VGPSVTGWLQQGFGIGIVDSFPPARYLVLPMLPSPDNFPKTGVKPELWGYANLGHVGTDSGVWTHEPGFRVGSPLLITLTSTEYEHLLGKYTVPSGRVLCYTSKSHQAWFGAAQVCQLHGTFPTALPGNGLPNFEVCRPRPFYLQNHNLHNLFQNCSVFPRVAAGAVTKVTRLLDVADGVAVEAEAGGPLGASHQPGSSGAASADLHN
jgi:hypothetical protein